MSTWTDDPGTTPPLADTPTRPSGWVTDEPTQPLPAWPTGTVTVPPAVGQPPFGGSPSGSPPIGAPPVGLPVPPPAPPLGELRLPPPLAAVPPARVGGGRRRARKLGAGVLAAALVAGAGFGIGRLTEADEGAASTADTVLAARTSDAATPTTTARSATPGSSGGAGNGPTTTVRSETASTVSGQAGPNLTAPRLDPNLEVAAAVNKAVSPAVVQIEVRNGLGTGFVYDAQGYILTAAHVVDGVTSVTVRLADGTKVPGRVLGADDNYDVGVVKVEARPGLAVTTLALKDAPVVGQTAIAIGSPFGLDQTVTQGIVSAVNRPVPSPSGNLVAMIQTDASINSGNSGGPLVDRQGRVIGINSQIRTNTGDNAGIGFAVPIDLAYDVAQSIMAGKPVDLGYLGVSSNGDAPDGKSGALLTTVAAGSPAAQAGLKVGDLVATAESKPIKDFTELAAIVRAKRPGDTVTLVVERDGQRQTITATVGKQGG